MVKVMNFSFEPTES